MPFRWPGTSNFLRGEGPLGISLAACLLFAVRGPMLFAHLSNPIWLAGIFSGLFAIILGSGLAVVRHGEALAEALGEPYGTLILTLSVTSIEAMSISAVMLHGANNPTLVSQTLFAVVMIVMNLMVGLSLLLGAWRHKEQIHNLQGANTYLGVIIPLAVLSLILPNFTTTTSGPTLSPGQSILLALASAGLYLIFLAVQTTRHSHYFKLAGDAGDEAVADGPQPPVPVAYHAVMLLAYLLPVIYLAEQFAHPVDYVIETLHQPVAIGGLAMALIVATPEAIGAVRAARANDLQRSINISLGSVLSTIGLTVPIMLIMSEVTGHSLYLGLRDSGSVMLMLTLALSIVTFASGRTNVMQGAVHLILFMGYFALIFQS
jgi:Ca2+:H+ antiporter